MRSALLVVVLLHLLAPSSALTGVSPGLRRQGTTPVPDLERIRARGAELDPLNALPAVDGGGAPA